MIKTQGRSQILQTVTAKLAGTKKLQSLTAKSSSHQKIQTQSGQSDIVQTASGQLTPDVESAKRPAKISTLL